MAETDPDKGADKGASSDTGSGTRSGAPDSSSERLCAIILDESTIGRASSEIEHERAIAIYDLVEENCFQPLPQSDNGMADFHGPYRLNLSLQEARLVFEILFANSAPLATHILSLTPFRKIVKDYYMICDSYYAAIKTATPSQIEAIDMGRRGLHNEGSQLLQDRLSGKIEMDFGTARRLFTLVCVLHWKG
uniref:UPF0262 family protein n=1 Tax=Pararhizobium sp. IMCC3301 TaxID=3067904 RepID=UPI00274121BC|nr:UPF0262 family protein [Pararhizobium sp. IMCC3301]